MGYVGHQSRTPFLSRAETPARDVAQPPPVSAILCLIVVGMAALVLVGRAFIYLFAAI